MRVFVPIEDDWEAAFGGGGGVLVPYRTGVALCPEAAPESPRQRAGSVSSAPGFKPSASPTPAFSSST